MARYGAQRSSPWQPTAHRGLDPYACSAPRSVPFARVEPSYSPIPHGTGGVSASAAPFPLSRRGCAHATVTHAHPQPQSQGPLRRTSGSPPARHHMPQRRMCAAWRGEALRGVARRGVACRVESWLPLAVASFSVGCARAPQSGSLRAARSSRRPLHEAPVGRSVGQAGPAGRAHKCELSETELPESRRVPRLPQAGCGSQSGV